MMCYRDICFCLASNKFYEGEKCVNSDCMRHASTIPDNLPEWELFAYSILAANVEDTERSEEKMTDYKKLSEALQTIQDECLKK